MFRGCRGVRAGGELRPVQPRRKHTGLGGSAAAVSRCSGDAGLRLRRLRESGGRVRRRTGCRGTMRPVLKR
jgi:hypothetical protein